jgi:hypothetical protein
MPPHLYPLFLVSYNYDGTQSVSLVVAQKELVDRNYLRYF